MMSITEQTVIEAIQKGDAAAFKNLYFQYADMLYRFLWRKTRDEETARDLTQDLFMRVWNNRDTLKTDTSIKPYLYRIANNLAIDHLRKKVIRQSENLDDHSGAGAYYPEDWPDLEEQLKIAVKKLPAGQQTVFYLSRYEGLKYHEIAELLDKSPKTVENQISAALKQLRVAMKGLLLILLWIFYEVIRG